MNPDLAAKLTNDDLDAVARLFGADGWLAVDIRTREDRKLIDDLSGRGVLVLDKHPTSPTDGRKPFWVWRITDEGRRALLESSRARPFPDRSRSYVPPRADDPATVTLTVRARDLEPPRRGIHPIFGTPCVFSDTITLEWVERHELHLRRDELARWESEGGRG